MTSKKRNVEALWQDFFTNTSQWWDHRPEKINPKFPDFKHKQTQESLWLGDTRNPLWVQAALAALPPGTVQSNAFAWAQKLKRLVKDGQYVKTMEVFHQMQQGGICPHSWTFLPVLNACAGLQALEEGKRVHAQIRQVGCESDICVSNSLVDMYAKCGSIEDAWSVFNNMREHDVVTWNAMIGGYVKSGEGRKAMALFQQMQRVRVDPNSVTFVAVLNACASLAALEEGRHLHAVIIQVGCESNVYVATCLVDMYAKCGSIEDAWTVFSKMGARNVITWNAMIGGYVKSGKGLRAMELFHKMQQAGVEPNMVTFVEILNACASVSALEDGRCVHRQIIQVGCESDVYIATCLLNMYIKCWSIEDALIVFNKIRDHDVVTWNAMIVGYVRSGQEIKAMELFWKMQQEGVEPNAVTFVGLLNACSSLKTLEEGKHIHKKILQVGCQSDVYVATSLIDMYAKCGNMEDAWDVFNKMGEHDVVTWSAMIGGYVETGQGLKAMALFREMQQGGVEPNAVTFVGVLNACGNVRALEEGRCIHSQVIQRGYESDVYVVNCLIDMYANCGSMEDAWTVFNKIAERNVVTWNAMIGGYAKSGQGIMALELFWKMRQEGMEPSTVTFIRVLNGCASIAALEEGRRVHTQIMRIGYKSDVYVATCLVDMYARCGSIEEAWSVFNKMQDHDLVAWNTMILAYVKAGQRLKAVELYQKMQEEGVKPNPVTFVGILNACASLAALEDGRRVHTQIIQVGCESDVYVATCLVNMYAKCGSIEDAWDVFSKMKEHDLVAWSAMIGGYVDSGQGLKAMELFRNMQQEGVEPNAVTFIAVLNACASMAGLEEGRHVHGEIIRRGWDSEAALANCLINMYVKCESIEDAWRVFSKIRDHDVSTWNVMIGGYVKSGQGLTAMELFQEMQQEGVEPNAITFIAVLNACANAVDLEGGRRIHRQITEVGYASDVYVATCLIDMFVKCGSIEDAWGEFCKMQERDVVVWNVMIGGYVKCGQVLKAMELFQQMKQEAVEPNAITFVGVLSACASVAALEEGRRVHTQITQVGCESDLYVATGLVDMYAKCGSIEDAWVVFNKMGEHNVATWNAMIGGYAMHGRAKKAIELLKRMGKESIEINDITLTCLLSSCSHGVLVKEGLRYFKSMSLDFDILPTVEHYACMIDLLGRAGRLGEAEELLNKMPFEANVSLWMSLLGACRIHGNLEMAERAAKQCWELDPGCSTSYVLLSNIYVAIGMYGRNAPIEEERLAREIYEEQHRAE